jgi:hypothetical protein
MGDNEQRGTEGLDTREEAPIIDQNRDIDEIDRNHENRPEAGETMMSDYRNSQGVAQTEVGGGETEDNERSVDRAYRLKMGDSGNGKEDETEVGDVPASKAGDEGREDFGTGGLVETGFGGAAASLTGENGGSDDGGGILEDSDAEEEENEEEEVSADGNNFQS